MMMMRFFRWQRRRCSGKREKKPTTTSCYYFKTCACVTCWNETLESSRCWRVAERERERESARYTFWGMMRSKMIRNDERSEKDFQRDILRNANERDTREQERRGFVRLGAESFGSVKKISIDRDRFLWIFDKFLVFSFWFELSTQSASRKRPHWKRDNYALNTSTMAKRTKSARKAAKSKVRPQSFSRVKRQSSLTFCCPSFLRA